jgi:hypothetical protein
MRVGSRPGKGCIRLVPERAWNPQLDTSGPASSLTRPNETRGPGVPLALTCELWLMNGRSVLGVWLVTRVVESRSGR